ncbi:MAG: hypothetical protein KDD38_10565, partial [Bdellovibrionales bacterium]|nr:hypothetical protein [Bdellovibrionales bacterium]
HRVQSGDRLIGVESSGFHSNGYSLLRKLFADDLRQWAEKLLTPTHLYPKMVRNLLSQSLNLHAIAHVTGGGLDNLLRVLPEGLALELKPWPVPELFLEVKKRGKMEWSDLLLTLNCGIGLVLYVEANDFDKTMTLVKENGFRAYDMGVVVSGSEKKWSLDFNKLEAK